MLTALKELLTPAGLLFVGHAEPLIAAKVGFRPAGNPQTFAGGRGVPISDQGGSEARPVPSPLGCLPPGRVAPRPDADSPDEARALADAGNTWRSESILSRLEQACRPCSSRRPRTARSGPTLTRRPASGPGVLRASRGARTRSPRLTPPTRHALRSPGGARAAMDYQAQVSGRPRSLGGGAVSTPDSTGVDLNVCSTGRWIRRSWKPPPRPPRSRRKQVPAPGSAS